jgi:hypothetical protein
LHIVPVPKPISNKYITIYRKEFLRTAVLRIRIEVNPDPNPDF